MICFGQPGYRRIGRHRWQSIGRATMYGTRLLRVMVCAFCDHTAVDG